MFDAIAFAGGGNRCYWQGGFYEAAAARLGLELGVDDYLRKPFAMDQLIDSVRRALGLPEPAPTSWGARLLTLTDPDGLPVSLLEWTAPPPGAPNQS